MTAPSELEEFVAALNWYVRTVECIAGEHVEPRLAEISLPAEYRWEIDTSTENLLDHPLSRFSPAQRETIATFAKLVRAVPSAAPELSHRDWQKARELAQGLLPVLRSHQASFADVR